MMKLKKTVGAISFVIAILLLIYGAMVFSTWKTRLLIAGPTIGISLLLIAGVVFYLSMD
ncbi:hypothetical protein GWN63_03985 [Candidatus Bathyarchaeota archaeon]|nr:hypothetical protein [Candidatus Bathyarchaeota archaeon]NIR15185.1 hypothetical protein [Desulfobacterales bacterium]NIU81390.1 hypothetical protein [Candidatus Bathyarchaeota archaeon]NIV68016.1 hypothetical protein [Candidatus Bathyarchaeota archaeon]NIW34553.1 hypothetical protein [Candidatus Bathyarchaeota archaeon]